MFGVKQEDLDCTLGIGGADANIRWIIEKAKEFQKNIYFCFIDYAITVRSPQNGKCQLDSRVNQSHKTSAGFETTFN